MSYEVKTEMSNPLEWMFEYGEWTLIDDYSNRREYTYLDNIFHCLQDGINPNDIKGLEGKSVEDLKNEYQERFPLLLASAFENIANEIRKGDLKLKIDFQR